MFFQKLVTLLYQLGCKHNCVLTALVLARFAAARSCWAAVFLMASAAVVCVGQEGAPEKAPPLSPPNPVTADEQAEQAEELDSDGTVELPRMQYEVLQRIERFLNEQLLSAANATEPVTLESVKLNGEVENGFVKLTLQATAQVHRPSFVPVRIPLGLSNMIVSEFTSAGHLDSRILPATADTSAASEFRDPPPLNGSQAPTASAVQSQLLASMDTGIVWELFPDTQREVFKEILTSPTEPPGENITGRKCELTLKGYIKIESSGRKRTVQFDLPNVISQATISLPILANDVTWSEGPNQKLELREIENALLVDRIGIGDSSELAWTESNSNKTVQSTEIKSITRFEASLDGTGWEALTTLVVNSISDAGTRDFELRLPPNSEWNPVTDSTVRAGWTITLRNPPPNSDQDPGLNSGARLQLRVTAEEIAKGTNPIEIRWTWQPPAKLGQDFLLQTIGIESAERHDGVIEVLLPAQSQLKWKTGENSSLVKRSIEAGPTELLNYTFKFSRTPVDITAAIQESVAQLQYRPEFLATLNSQAIELTGLLNFSTDPSQMVGLEIELGDWIVKDIVWNQSGQAIEYNQDANGTVHFDPVSLYRRSDPTGSVATANGRVIKLSLLKPLPVDQASGNIDVEIKPPSIVWLNDQGEAVNDVGNGWLAIAAPSWQVQKRAIQLQSLTAVEEQPPLLASILKAEEVTLFQAYLFNDRSGAPAWKSTLRRKPNLATQMVETDVRIDQDSYRVQKTWKIRQNNWKDLKFQLIVPDVVAADLIATGEAVPLLSSSVFTLNGARVRCQVAPVDVASESDESLPASIPEGWVVVLPELGETPEQFDLQLGMSVPLQPKNESTTGGSASEVESSSLEIPYLLSDSPLMTVDKHVKLAVDAAWKADFIANGRVVTVYPGQVAEPTLLADSVGRLPMKLERLALVRPAAVQINQVWLQTALNNSDRRDRCVVDLSTAARQLELELANADISNLTSVLVDGQRIEPQRVEGTSSLIIMLPRSPSTAVGTSPESEDISPSNATNDVGPKSGDLQTVLPAVRRYTIEIWLWSRVSRNYIDRVQEVLPRIKDANEPAPKIWQVLVPEYDHLWTASARLMPEYNWQWNGLSLQRQSVMQQKELELLTRATEQPAFGVEANRYLFTNLASEFGKDSREKAQYVFIVPRYVLFAPVCLLCIIVTCLLLYIPALRTVWMLGVTAAIATVFATVSTDLAIIVTQAIAASLFFVAVLLLLRWSIHRRVYQRSVFANRSRGTSSTVAPANSVDFGTEGSSENRSTDSSVESFGRGPNSIVGSTKSIQIDSAERHKLESREAGASSVVEGL